VYETGDRETGFTSPQPVGKIHSDFLGASVPLCVNLWVPPGRREFLPRPEWNRGRERTYHLRWLGPSGV